MDFLVLFAMYILLCVVAGICYHLRDKDVLKKGFVGKIRSSGYKIVVLLMPSPIQSLFLDLYERFILRRNAAFQVLYVMLVVAGYGVIVFDALPYLYGVAPNTNHVFVPLLLLVINSVFFAASSMSDAGEIRPANHELYECMFEYDGILFQPGNKCRTCLFIKPARSKHCAIYDKCIFKFDHYCAWTNNCVGGLNHRYFVGFLISLTLMSVNAVYMNLVALINITNMLQLYKAQYLDYQGNPQPMNFHVLTQTLFMEFPRPVFLVASLGMVALVVSGFTVYHVYLAFTNQTTNERYKKYALENKENIQVENIYNRGIWQNLKEEFCPLQAIKRVKSSLALGKSSLKNISHKHVSNGRAKKRSERLPTSCDHCWACPMIGHPKEGQLYHVPLCSCCLKMVP